ncbi:hypothetical protein [Agrobacterium tumefaciens]|uniref:hypothetical protein n=1 Tax=Agrobacterium tumefaciens TaxID=358 RepID=UPI003B9FDBDB
MSDVSLIGAGEVTRNVLGGTDGYLFLQGGSHSEMEYLEGTRKPSDLSVRNFANNISSRRRYCHERGIRYSHVVYPSKAVVCKSHLAEPSRSSVASLYEQAYYPELDRSSRNSVLYPSGILKKLGRPYRLHDTHLSHEGCVAVTDELFDKVGLGSVELSEIATTTGDIIGDLSLMLGSDTKVSETIYKSFSRTEYIVDNSQYLKGNTGGVTVCHNWAADRSSRILIMGDSFIRLSLYLFAAKARDVLYVRTPNFQPDLIELFKPDVVITANAERYMAEVDADSNGDAALFESFRLGRYENADAYVAAIKAQLSFRHHRSVYDQWRAEIMGRTMQLKSGIGYILAVPNDQISRSGSGSQFVSTGIDPQFRFYIPEKLLDGAIEVVVSMRSEVSSEAVIYASEYGTLFSAFSPERRIRQNVSPGENRLIFTFDQGSFGRELRLDPLSRMGKFEIMDLTVKQI